VIVFDNLINEAMLTIAPENCQKIYVGKHPYGEYVPQEDINALIDYYCTHFSNLVRLEGGDPYMFGRGFDGALVAIGLGVVVVCGRRAGGRGGVCSGY